ncbi:uncharacterized protein N7483_007798 [Penicillium malachiteum]|uniref:uncharacterized protein n=1 Tax=Penicillium malachiteum TaxID=1324776 RepID=UPI0025498A07|nr:uncharacterized protein N7483_007798 [Penicillium malachiteum]KAJ5726441.1 hypothetical protein N7483_007798 [Penicillium malachiteum]
MNFLVFPPAYGHPAQNGAIAVGLYAVTGEVGIEAGTIVCVEENGPISLGIPIVFQHYLPQNPPSHQFASESILFQGSSSVINKNATTRAIALARITLARFILLMIVIIALARMLILGVVFKIFITLVFRSSARSTYNPEIRKSSMRMPTGGGSTCMKATSIAWARLQQRIKRSF